MVAWNRKWGYYSSAGFLLQAEVLAVRLTSRLAVHECQEAK